MGTAMADPSGAPTFRDLAGTGSDTTQGVMNSLSNLITIGGTKEIGSYDAASPTNSAQITTKDPAVNPNCTINRPSGSGAGLDALVAARNATTPPAPKCLQFARSSKDDHATRAGQHLTYIPFATDAVAYAVLQTSSINKRLSVATLKSIYTCDPNFTGFTPLLPQFGSGTRQFFLQNILGLTDSPTYTTSNSCVSDNDPIDPTRKLLENTGNRLLSDSSTSPTAKQQIEPYAISSYIAQTANTVSDVHGRTVLGNIGGINSLTINGNAVGTRPVFNVVPNVLVQSGPHTQNVFVGGTSQVCTNAGAIQSLGFATRSDCGSTAIQTDTSNGADTVGPGE
ncbi:MAG: hypothetical protein DLM60_12155 [Pseudonocardiales bacterium]|nr:MAG: hypothetical protein DLM60_12155 [Pseudonocardiales bacterium]